MPTIGYGEDGLTFHALHEGRADLLRAVGDQRSEKNDCLVYFRPSFGRAGGVSSSQFGEFDAILCTKTFVYLIESKWNSGDQAIPVVVLPEVQRTRHLIFAWLYENWVQVFGDGAVPTWEAFYQAKQADFATSFANRPLAPPGSLLARNLLSILSGITPGSRRLKNVLLFHSPEGVPGPTRIVTPTGGEVIEPKFDLVIMPYEPIGASRFFQMRE